MRFKVIKRKFKIDNVNELSKGCRVSRIISCSVENLDSGELLKIKSPDLFNLEPIDAKDSSKLAFDSYFLAVEKCKEIS